MTKMYKLDTEKQNNCIETVYDETHQTQRTQKLLHNHCKRR